MHPRLPIVTAPTPLDPAENLSAHLGIDLHIKRDDLAGPTLGGNKARQLEYYFGAAQAERADVILITGAVQSNFARLAVAIARRQGMEAVIQLEDRVPGKPAQYRAGGNVLLSRLMGAEILNYPEGEDEAGADAALHTKAEALRAEGKRPYVIHLSEGHPPLGALGYVDAAHEILAQKSDFDIFVVASGSGSTHAGLLAGLRGAGCTAPVIGSCVRRAASVQTPRIRRVTDRLAKLHDGATRVTDADIITWDGALSPGYGQLGPAARDAMEMMARHEGLMLDPVYTAKSFAAIPALVASGEIPKGSRVCFVHTGGLAALFAYEAALTEGLEARPTDLPDAARR
ncbi:D-cysteine desulfhydrase family protein [Jannaschia sp. CCS1]|uniref:D-cysteine desulfhydrase family protein n=1 Tax=Jannaschia sp. (strain CCS1) TaxID=290400 RepID=UPI00006C0082|nr:D-cysteine desulfhydrase family protein [Jannaschia sp. CCS1]ABD55793.1 1-aminocyclopropane-1-carboxylate deaminase [Jannaschia sp. CCS1]